MYGFDSNTMVYPLLCRLLKRFDRIRAQMYDAQVKEVVPRGYQSHVFVMRVLGTWSTVDDSPWYKWLTIVLFLFVGILYPASVLIVTYYSVDIAEAINHICLAISCSTTAIKIGVTLWRRDHIRDIFRIHTTLMNTSGSDAVQNDRVARINYLVHVGSITLYSSSVMAVCFQVAVSKPEDGIFPSTAPLPFEFAHRRSVYLGGLVCQIICAYCSVFWAATMDSLFFALINTVCGHVGQLKKRLQSLGSQGDDVTFYRELMECCKCYENCLSLAKSINNVLSLALFAQFGGSILNMCFGMYLISIVSIKHTCLH